MAKERLDVLLVQKGICESRERAKSSIMAGLVYVNGERADKAGSSYAQDVEIELKENSNPYQLVFTDASGQAAIDWGVYGTPETYVIDKKGVIRYKQIGPIDEEVWQNKLNPLITQLQGEV